MIQVREESGQPASCMAGFDQEAKRAAQEHRDDLRSIADIKAWLRKRPHEDDTGVDPGRRIEGCEPPQRTRWFSPTLNCWERALHFAAWHLANGQSLENFEFVDAKIGNIGRHIYVVQKGHGDISLELMPASKATGVSDMLAAANLALASLEQDCVTAANFDLSSVLKGAGTGATVGSVGGTVGSIVGGALGGALSSADELLKEFGVIPKDSPDLLTRITGNEPRPSATPEPKTNWFPWLALLGGLLLLRKGSA